MRSRIFNVTPEQDEKLRDLAKRSGVCRSEHVRRAIDEYFVKHVKPIKRKPVK
jgi:predicted DNA-binding protein